MSNEKCVSINVYLKYSLVNISYKYNFISAVEFKKIILQIIYIKIAKCTSQYNKQIKIVIKLQFLL